MIAQMHKLAEQQEFERAQEIKKRIKSLDLLQQEQSFNSTLTSVDFFTCVSKLDRTGICILSVRNGKIRGTKTHYLKGNQLHDIDSLFQSLIFSYYYLYDMSIAILIYIPFFICSKYFALGSSSNHFGISLLRGNGCITIQSSGICSTCSFVN